MFYDTKKDKQLHPNLLPTTSILDIYSNSFFLTYICLRKKFNPNRSLGHESMWFHRILMTAVRKDCV